MHVLIPMATLAASAGLPGVPPIVLPQEYQAQRASSADPTGGNTDHIAVPAGATVPFATLAGPGIVRHCWFTIRSEDPQYLDRLILRMTWDGADRPAVEAPFGAFFGMGHGEVADLVSAAITVMAGTASYIAYPPGLAAFNCYFAMPFQRKAVLSVENTSDVEARCFFFHVDYQKHRSLPRDVRYFHARYRAQRTEPGPEPDGCNVTGKNNYVLLDVEGQGHYIGCTLHIESHRGEAGKWYEGDDMICVDGCALKDGILGTGTEDYFNMAWGVRRNYQSPCSGTSYLRWNPGEPEMGHWGRFSLYRWHLPDPIPFQQSLRVTIEHGHNNDAANRYQSVAYWYAASPE